MDPFTAGMVVLGATGGSLVVIGLLEQAGVKLNEGLVTLILEAVKYGGILYLIYHLKNLFF